jgi:hypothetical protein
MEALFTFNSTRNAIESEKVLLSSGLTVQIMAKPSKLGADCGFSITMPQESVTRAQETLRLAGLEWADVYLKTHNLGEESYTKIEAN